MNPGQDMMMNFRLVQVMMMGSLGRDCCLYETSGTSKQKGNRKQIST